MAGRRLACTRVCCVWPPAMCRRAVRPGALAGFSNARPSRSRRGGLLSDDIEQGAIFKTQHPTSWPVASRGNGPAERGPFLAAPTPGTSSLRCARPARARTARGLSGEARAAAACRLPLVNVRLGPAFGPRRHEAQPGGPGPCDGQMGYANGTVLRRLLTTNNDFNPGPASSHQRRWTGATSHGSTSDHQPSNGSDPVRRVSRSALRREHAQRAAGAP